jgi:hypothetical protein
MAYLAVTAGQPTHDVRMWRRARRRSWTRGSDCSRLERLLAQIPSLPRASLSRLTTRLIERMDQLDGDQDLEDLTDDWEDGHDREQACD